jgi:parallel beta-helix repeat protein
MKKVILWVLVLMIFVVSGCEQFTTTGDPQLSVDRFDRMVKSIDGGGGGGGVIYGNCHENAEEIKVLFYEKIFEYACHKISLLYLYFDPVEEIHIALISVNGSMKPLIEGDIDSFGFNDFFLRLLETQNETSMGDDSVRIQVCTSLDMCSNQTIGHTPVCGDTICEPPYENEDTCPADCPFLVSCGANITEDTVLNNDLLDCEGNGLIISVDNVTLDCNNHIIEGHDSNTIQPPSNYGIRVYGDNVTIKNCAITHFRAGIMANRIRELKAHNNHIDDCWSGILTEYSINASFIGNEITDSLVYGIFLRFDIIGNDIINNTLGGNGIVYGAGGIYMGDTDSCYSNKIIGNTILFNEETGIFIRNCEDTLIEGNLLKYNANSCPTHAAIYVQYADFTRINNNFIQSSINGLHIQHSLVYLNNNTISNNIANGIYFLDSSGEITNNSIFNNNVGIDIIGSNNQLFSNNDIFNNEELALSITNSFNNTFSSNYFSNDNYYVDERSDSQYNKWNLSDKGNYWDNFEGNPGFPNYYVIGGDGEGIDYKPICSDKTIGGECSVTKPLYCNHGSLIENCQACGCASGFDCQSEGSCSSVQADNLIQNPSFEIDFNEDSIPDGWDTYNDLAVMDGDAQSGASSVQISNSRTGFVSQYVPIDESKTYRVSGWMKVNATCAANPNCEAVLGLFCYDGSVNEFNCPIDFDDWLRVDDDTEWIYMESDPFTIDSQLGNPTHIEISCSNSPFGATGLGAIWCDSFKLEEITSSQAVSGDGFCEVDKGETCLSEIDDCLGKQADCSSGEVCMGYDSVNGASIPGCAVSCSSNFPAGCFRAQECPQEYQEITGYIADMSDPLATACYDLDPDQEAHYETWLCCSSDVIRESPLKKFFGGIIDYLFST